MQTVLPPSAQAPVLRARRETATRHIQELMRTVLRGPSKDVFKLSKPSKSSGVAAFNDRFVLSVQLGTGAVQWTLMLDGMRPECAPDIIFDEGSEDFSATLEYAELEAIKTWDVTRETALLELLQELHGKLLTHHLTRVQTFSDAQVKFELESIMAHAPHAQLRFINDKDRTVECVVPIYHGREVAAATRAASVSASPATCAAHQVCQLVLVLDQAMKAVHSALHYPPSTPPTQRAECPRWIPGETHALDLLPMVQALVERKQAQKQVRAVVMQHLCDTLAPLYMDSAHERCAFLCQMDASFEAVVHVSVPELFPDEPPTLLLQSVVHLVDRLPLSHTPPVITWNAAWPVAEMVSYLVNVISAELELFRKRVLQQVRPTQASRPAPDSSHARSPPSLPPLSS